MHSPEFADRNPNMALSPETFSTENSSRRDLFVTLALTAILIFGAAMRLVGVNWDADQHLHPDERFLTMVESALALPGAKNVGSTAPALCAKWGGYFDTPCSPLSPYNHNFGFFVYGTFPIFLTRIVGDMLSLTGYGEIHLVGRVLSALFDWFCIILIFFIGRRMYGTRAALLGAFFLSASALDIQQSHFFTVDTFTNVPILLAFWFALDITEGKGARAFALAGAMFGLALAGRINIVPFAAVLIAAAALRAYLDAERARKEHASRAEREFLENGIARQVREMYGMRETRETLVTRHSSLATYSRAFAGLVACALIALVVFRILQPYAANGPNFFSPRVPRVDLSKGALVAGLEVALFWAGGVNPQFADNMNSIGDFISGKVDFPPNHQWTDRPAYIFPFENIVLWGLGLPLGLAAWAGFAFATGELIFKKRWEHLLIVLWIGITFAYTGQQFAKTIRYFLQLYPFLCLLAGYLLVKLWDRVYVTPALASGARVASTSASLSVNSAKQSPSSNLETPALPKGYGASVASSQRPLLAMTNRTLLARVGVALLALIVIGYTLFWSLAFTSIYTRPVSRVTASRWIFENVPHGSVIANEHWDDPLPLRIDGKDPFGGMYRGLKSSSDGLMQWYAEDTFEKRAQAIQWLDEADYIVLSSNRLYKTIPRLPMRYPLTTKYYEWLFDGALGFENAATITSRPQLFGIEIADDDAEESFTVYDHPKVLIFKKTPRYSSENTRALFNSVNLAEVYRFQPVQATQAKTALLLTESAGDAQRAGGTWRDIFDPDDVVNRIPVLVWVALVTLLGWLAFPLAFVAFRALADRGYIFAKALGILIPAFLAWIFASVHLLPFSRASILVAIVLLAGVSAFVAWRARRDLLAFFRARAATLVAQEIFFLVFFVSFLLIRFGNPDLWHPNFGGEKPMDFAYLNAVIKSSWFPPYDPWFAGGFINYYYYGFVLTATLIKFSGIVPEVAYNLAIPLYFALTGMGAFSVVFNLVAKVSPTITPSTFTEFILSKANGLSVNSAKQSPNSNTEIASAQKPRLAMTIKPYAFALLGALFVVVIGNLGELLLILEAFLRSGGGNLRDNAARIAASIFSGIVRVFTEGAPLDVPTGNWYWTATRVIPDTINEFPFFTFLYADLHAHLMALPYTLVALGFAVNFVLRERDDAARLPFLARLPVSPADVVEITLAALVVGALRPLNTWDYPTYLAVLACALGIGEYARRGCFDRQGLFSIAWRFGAIFILSNAFYLPFIRNYATAYTSVELWQAGRTAVPEYLVVHGIFLFALAAFLVAQVFDTPARRGAFRFLRLLLKKRARLNRFGNLHRVIVGLPSLTQDLALIFFASIVILEILLIVLGFGVFALVLPLGMLAAVLLLRADLAPARRLVALLIGAALAMTLMVEVITLRGDIGRMNTVFKFYLQVWVLFGVCAAAGLGLVTTDDGRRTMAANRPPSSVLRPRFLWWSFFALLVFIGMLYPIFATRAKVNDRFVAGDTPGLNGMDYMRGAVYYDQNKELILEFDRQAIEWVRENIAGSPVILEGNAPLYHWGSRIGIYTGLPGIIGWDWHQKQQRSIVDGALIDQRIANVRQIYNSRDGGQAVELLKRYKVAYIVVGDLERAFYTPDGLAKFDTMAQSGLLELVYQNERVKIYRVKG